MSRRIGEEGGVRAVFFDAVGTIIRPYPAVGSVYARSAAAFGIRCPPRTLERNFRLAYRELLPKRFFGAGGCRTSEPRERGWWKEAVGRTFERAGCAPVPPKVREAAFDAFSRGEAWRPYADVVPVMERLLSAGLRLGVISNFDSRLRRVIAELGLSRYCTHLVISSEQGWAKPSPRIYLEAARRAGVRPGEALHVGDREVEDCIGPRRAGLRALWLVRDGSRRGDHVIPSLRALPGRLGIPRFPARGRGGPLSPRRTTRR